MTKAVSNPWQREGVSILPADLTDLMPIVGQEELFKKLARFRDDILATGKQGLTGFFLVIGGWGVGKSRVGHEVCLEALDEEVHWIVRGKPERVLEASLAQGILPIFLRYVQVTKGPLGAELEADDWIARVAVEGLCRLAGLRGDGGANAPVRNQDRLLDRVRKVLKPRGWDRVAPDLCAALQKANATDAARAAIETLKGIGIKHFWLVVDEIEDITDVERDGLKGERVGIDQALLTMIPRVIKAEEVRQEFPEINFLLLCSQAVGDLLKQIRAIERRTTWHELVTNSFADVEAFFRYLEQHRRTIATAIGHYPAGLKEAAFFAANRNFGWFNVVMHHVHENLRNGTVEAPELLRSFAELPTKGDKNSVFDLDAISEFRIPDEGDRDEITRAIFRLLPQAIGPDGVDAATAKRLREKREAGGNPIFTRLVEIESPPKHRLLAHMIGCGFKNTSGTELTLPGEVRFDLQIVLDSLLAYSIALPEARRDHLLICADEKEFTDQIAGLAPYSDRAYQFAPFLHGLLMDPAYRAKGQDGKELVYVGPAFSFLLEFNRLNRTRKAEEGYLRDSAANTRLEEAYRNTAADPGKRVTALLEGIARAWEPEPEKVALADVPGLKLPARKMTAQRRPLSHGRDGTAVLIYATNASEVDLESDLSRLARQPVPVLLIYEDLRDEALPDLRRRLNKNVPGIAPFVVIHNLRPQTVEHLVHLGLMGEAFRAEDLRTGHFHAVIGRAHEHLKQTLDDWAKQRDEEEGLVLRPLFYGSKITEDDMRAFACGYAALVTGRSFHDIVQPGNRTFSDERELDLFKRMADRNVSPGPKFQSAPRTVLLDEPNDRSALVPRSLISLLERCGSVPKDRADLERHFLFDLRDMQDNRPVGSTPKDVVRHFTDLLQCLGLIELDGEKLRRVSTHSLASALRAARNWLDGPFDQQYRAIKAIHNEAGEKLADSAKEARQNLKAAEKRLDKLSLDFIDRAWDELNQQTSGGVPAYETAFRDAVEVIAEVLSNIDRVYDAAKYADFRYSPDALREYELQAASPGYPLWKRAAVLKGFYDALSARRKELSRRIGETIAEVDARVSELTSGPDAGQKAFPTQPLTQPLKLYQQELNFGADRPGATIAAAGTTLGVVAVGFKIASGRYVEALERVEAIEADTDRNEPGKLVSTYLVLVKDWESLRKEAQGVALRLEAVEHFFADASAEVRKRFGLPRIQEECADLIYQVEGGGIRENTDGREDAGTPVFQLVDGLQQDLAKIRNLPRQLGERLEEVERGVVAALTEEYGKKHAARLSAFSRIRTAQNLARETWPEAAGETYGETVKRFDALVQQIDHEGKAFFAGCTDTTFEVLVGLCQMETSDKPIDWNVPEYKRHVDALMAKRLLELRLV